MNSYGTVADVAGTALALPAAGIACQKAQSELRLRADADVDHDLV